MASRRSRQFLLIFLYLFLTHPLSESTTQTRFKPTTLVPPVQKDSTTSLHVATISKRTPLRPLPFIVDLNGKLLWVNCEQHYLSSTYKAPFCRSTLCSRASAHYCFKSPSSPARPGCHNNTCAVLALNPITRQTATAELAQVGSSVETWTHRSSPLQQGPVPKNFQGIAGMGHPQNTLPTQLASHLGIEPQFSLSLTFTAKQNGVVFFGSGPFNANNSIVSLPPAVYPPLTVSPQGQYIQVSSIKVNNKPVSFDIARITKQGFVTTRISTTTPYTVLDHSIFTAFTHLFTNQLGQSAQARPGVWSLAFVDGRAYARGSIVIGAHQLEEYLVQFDLARSRVGFSSMLLSKSTSCSNLNFPSL
ncbi:hypothetical protein NMG60_11020715 [Bertholletia excelsa]